MRSTLIRQNLPSTITPISVSSIQNKLAKAQTEVASGRWSDVGYKLAEQTGQVIEVRAQISMIDTFESTNSMVAGRADVTQSVLTSLVAEAQYLFDSSVTARSTHASPEVVLSIARDGLGTMIANVNSTIQGVHVFGGINSDTPPMEDYFGTPASASKNAVDAAFLAEFGFTQSDPAVANITAAAMESFIDNAFGSLFGAASWSNDWSSATDETLKTKISFSEITQTTQTANESAIRKLAMAYTMVADLGLEGMNAETFGAVMDKAVDITSQSIGELNVLKGKIGITQQRMEIAGDKLVVQKNVFEKMVGEKENVDSYEVATRVSLLTNQLEASYTLTARLQQLSLVKFL